MKKSLKWTALSVLVMVALPWLAVTFVKSDAGMAVCFLLFFAVDPIFSVIVGAHAGNDAKARWFWPLLPAGFFLVGTWMFFDPGGSAFLLYAFLYLLLSAAAMLISAWRQRRAGR